MGRPKLPQTKEQIAIRLAPGTKARLSSLIRLMQSKGVDVPLRSEVLRHAIERGIEVMEAEYAAPARAPKERAAAAAPVDRSASSRARAVPPPPHMPVPSATRPQPPRAEPTPARAVVSQPARAPQPSGAAVSQPAPRQQPVPVAAPPPKPAPGPAAAPTPTSGRRGPIPGTVADRTLRTLRDMGATSAQVPLPALCRRVWPANPPRVHQALRELRDLGLIELVAGSPPSTNDSDDELIFSDGSGTRFGFVRLR